MSYEDVSNYSDATRQFYHKAYSDDFRMQKFAEVNRHVSNNSIIQAIEQELIAFQCEHNAVIAESYLTEAQHYLNLLKYRTNERVKFKNAVNKNNK